MKAILAQSDVVTAYGWGLDALWDGLLSGTTAIRPTERFAERGFVSNQAAHVPDLFVENNESRAMAMLCRLLSPLVGKLPVFTALILSTTVGEIDFLERAVLERNLGLLEQSSPGFLLQRVQKLLRLSGPAMVVSSACASSALALTRAASMIRSNDVEQVLVVACDAVSEFVYSGFSALMSLCDDPARPFDAGRCGLTLGEAAAWTLVIRDDSKMARDAEASTIVGWGSTTDAIHMTAPDRNASGLSRAIAKACTMAKRSADDVAFIAAHGTATVYSDAMELVALRKTWERARPMFSVKGGVGHTLAAAGLVQILVAQRALARGMVPPTVGLATPDPNAVGWARNEPFDIGRTNLALSINSGFGGVNTAVLLERSSPS